MPWPHRRIGGRSSARAGGGRAILQGQADHVLVGSSAGGGYDIYARLLSRHMAKHIPGNPAMVVTNMAGAGSNAAAAHLFNVAPRDGTVIGALQNSAVLDALLDALLG